MLYFVNVFYDMKCLRNTYFVCSIYFVEYEIDVSFYFHKFFFGFKLWPPTGMNPGSVPTSIGNNPSYTWRSLMAAQNLVKEGLRWRVDNGASIHV